METPGIARLAHGGGKLLLSTEIGNWLLELVSRDAVRDSSMPLAGATGVSCGMIRDPEYECRVRTVPPDITEDTLWRMAAYRYALFAMWKAQEDIPLLARYRETRPLIDQLVRAVGAISANLEEGYGRSGAHDRAHFYEYALSTARESRGWYYKCARAFPPEILSARMSVLTQIVRMLTAIVPEIRHSKLRWRPKQEKPDITQPPDHHE